MIILHWCAPLAYWVDSIGCCNISTMEVLYGKSKRVDARADRAAGVAGISGAIAQPTILRECKSSTAARYSQPPRVRIYVMSHAQARSGRGWSSLACQHVGRDGQAVPAVSGVHELAPPNRPQAVGRWLASGFVPGAVPWSRPAVAALCAACGCRRRGHWRQRRLSSEHCRHISWVLGDRACAGRNSPSD